MGRKNAAQADGDSVSYRAARDLLQARQYAQVAEILERARVAAEQRDDQTTAQILSMARRLCLAGSQCRAEIEWYRRAQSDSDRQERDLQRRLRATLDLLGEIQTPESDEARSSVLAEKPEHLRVSPPTPPGRPGFWQRVRAFLDHAFRLRSTSFQGRRPTTDLSTPDEPRDVPAPVAGVDSPEETGPVRPVLSVAEQIDSAEPTGGPGPPGAAPFLKHDVPDAPSLVVYCLGPFRVFQDDQPVTEWPSAKGKAIFKYLIAHRQRPVVKEILMELFWPEMDPDAARNNLNVAIYGLRQALRAGRPTFSHVLYQDDCYLINPELRVWVDSEAFEMHRAAGQTLEEQSKFPEAMGEYRAAEALYQGEYMEDDRYEDWMIPRRRRLEARYLDLLNRLVRYSYDREHHAACIALCHKMLSIDPCLEEAHRRLMRCYRRQGQPYLALRQYHFCVERLKEELDMSPAPSTVALYERIRDM